MRQTEDATDLTEVWVDVDSGEDCAITKPELLSGSRSCGNFASNRQDDGEDPGTVSRPALGLPTLRTVTPKKAASKAKRKPSDKDQYERFRQAARELGTDESEEAFDRAFRKIIVEKKKSS
jgi:hypothetical protein